MAAQVALVWSHFGVLAEVVPQIAALAELLPTVLIFTAEVQLGPVGLWVLQFDDFVPLKRDPFEFLDWNY